MFSKSYSGAVDGINSFIVEVEADISDGMPEFSMVGALSSEVKEAKDRVRTALRNSGYMLPPKRITVNLSPADIKKEGVAFDLPIAVSVLAGSGCVSQKNLSDILIIGELSLDGSVKRVNGVLPIVYNARKKGYRACIVPKDNVKEGAVVEGIDVIGVSNVKETVKYLNDNSIIQPEVANTYEMCNSILNNYAEDFSDINGQEMLKRAIEIAVCGNHNILIIGPPGSGKTMAAKRIPSIMPPLSFDESIEISKVYSVSGMLDNDNALILSRPFRAPHHTITTSALTGGGRIPKPGEISLASKGVLFLDEFPEFDKRTIEILRQPLEEGSVTISRLNATYKYPADFLLVAAMNPCKCGYYPNRNKCHCSLRDIRQYLGKISKPLLDRIDICVEAPRVDYKDLKMGAKKETSYDIRERIVKARMLQLERYKDEKITNNASLTATLMDKYCKLGNKEREMMERVYDKYNMSARTYHRVLKVARTIADLEGMQDINVKHLSEAVCYRNLDKKYWDNNMIAE